MKSWIAVVLVPVLFTGAADAKPCGKHPVKAERGQVSKAKCLKAHKRAKQAWPRNPTVAEIRRRVDRIGGHGTYAKAWRIARCETGANPRHFPSGRYVGMMGMFHRTYAYGARVTSYPTPHTATPQQQIAIAVASWPITKGWSGWGCSSA